MTRNNLYPLKKTENYALEYINTLHAIEYSAILLKKKITLSPDCKKLLFNVY